MNTYIDNLKQIKLNSSFFLIQYNFPLTTCRGKKDKEKYFWQTDSYIIKPPNTATRPGTSRNTVVRKYGEKYGNSKTFWNKKII